MTKHKKYLARLLFMPLLGSLPSLPAIAATPYEGLEAAINEVAPGVAEVEDEPKDWVIGGALNFWPSGVKGKMANGANIDIPFEDTLNNLDTALLAGLFARKDKWILAADLVYVSTETKSTSSQGPFSVRQTEKVKNWIGQLSLGYMVYRTDWSRVDIFGGTRVLGADIEIKGDISQNGNPVGQVKRDKQRSFWAGVVGGETRLILADKWSFLALADVGAGEENQTWQLAGTFNYHGFSPITLTAGYRYIKWELDNSVVDDLAMQGPFMGVVYMY